tara:strand:- start:167 stop:361 length:195 start_codon:yes stop_codon:yes gene_type:complete
MTAQDFKQVKTDCIHLLKGQQSAVSSIKADLLARLKTVKEDHVEKIESHDKNQADEMLEKHLEN